MIGDRRDEDLSLQSWNCAQLFRNAISPLPAQRFDCGIVLLQEIVHGSDQADNFLFRHLHPAPDSV